MAVHVVLLAVPAVAGGFLQTFQFAFLLWPFNLALPLARHLPRACIALRRVASFYAAELQCYVSGTRSGDRLMPPRSHQYNSSLRDGVQQRTHEEVVAHAMIALVDIY